MMIVHCFGENYKCTTRNIQFVYQQHYDNLETSGEQIILQLVFRL